MATAVSSPSLRSPWLAVNEKNHTEIITPLTPITIREKDENGNTRIHKLIESKKVTELKRFIEENTEILKATPIIDDFQSVPAICLRNDRGENPLHDERQLEFP